MRLTLALVLSVACTAALAAGPGWVWLDKDGRKVFSDRPPPAEVPDKSILKRPDGRMEPMPAAGGDAPASPGVAAQNAAPPAGSGVDKALQEKRKAAEAADAARKKADEERNARVMAETCARATQAKAGLDSGGRMARINENGERVFLDESAISAESQRLQGIMAENCR